MHSSRMRTARSSSRRGGGGGAGQFPLNFPLGVGLDQIPLNFPLGMGLDQIPLNFPLGCGPGPDPPQLPPWLWAWTRSPSTSPLVVGLEPPPPQDQAPPGTRHPTGTRHPSRPGTHPGTRHPPGTRHTPLWTEFLTHASEHITLPQTSFAGGNNN